MVVDRNTSYRQRRSRSKSRKCKFILLSFASNWVCWWGLLLEVRYGIQFWSAAIEVGVTIKLEGTCELEESSGISTPQKIALRNQNILTKAFYSRRILALSFPCKFLAILSVTECVQSRTFSHKYYYPWCWYCNLSNI